MISFLVESLWWGRGTVPGGSRCGGRMEAYVGVETTARGWVWNTFCVRKAGVVYVLCEYFCLFFFC